MLYKEILQRQWPRKLTYCVKKKSFKKKVTTDGALQRNLARLSSSILTLFFVFVNSLRSLTLRIRKVRNSRKSVFSTLTIYKHCASTELSTTLNDTYYYYREALC